MDLSETCSVLCEIKLRNSASRWLSFYEYVTMHGPLNVEFIARAMAELYTVPSVTSFMKLFIFLA